MSIRSQRVGNVIRGIIAESIQTQLNDPRIRPMTSVTRVEVTGDFAIARIFVSVMGTPSQQKLTVQALRGSATRLRTEVKQRISTRTVPWLEFHLDESIQGAMRTVDALDQMRGSWETDSAQEGDVDVDSDPAEASIGGEADEEYPDDIDTFDQQSDEEP